MHQLKTRVVETYRRILEIAVGQVDVSNKVGINPQFGRVLQTIQAVVEFFEIELRQFDAHQARLGIEAHVKVEIGYFLGIVTQNIYTTVAHQERIVLHFAPSRKAVEVFHFGAASARGVADRIDIEHTRKDDIR